MKPFKSFYEEMTFKVDIEGLPQMFMSGNSPGEVKANLRKLIKQPSLIKGVDRVTKHDVKKKRRDQAKLGEEKRPGQIDYASDECVKRVTQITPGQKKEDTELDERTPVRPTIKDKKLKNLRIPNPNYKGGLKRKKDNERSADVYREACWDGYRQVGTKMKGGKSVPNCVPEDCGCEKCKSKKVSEKLTIGKIRRAAYKTGKVLGDVQAVKKNKVARRVKNRIIGKMAAKALSGLFK